MTLEEDLEKKAERIRELNVQIWKADCDKNILTQELQVGIAQLEQEMARKEAEKEAKA